MFEDFKNELTCSLGPLGWKCCSPGSFTDSLQQSWPLLAHLLILYSSPGPLGWKCCCSLPFGLEVLLPSALRAGSAAALCPLGRECCCPLPFGSGVLLPWHNSWLWSVLQHRPQYVLYSLSAPKSGKTPPWLMIMRPNYAVFYISMLGYFLQKNLPNQIFQN